MNNKDAKHHGYKETKIGLIPDDWECTQTKNVVSVKGGYAFESTRFKSSGLYQVIKMSNIYMGKLDLTRTPVFLDNILEIEKDYVLVKDNIILSLTGTIGKKDYGYSVIIKENRNLLLNQRLGVLKVNEKNGFSYYINYAIKTDLFLNQFFLSSRGGTGNQANVGITDVENIYIPLPPLPEQKKIADILSTWDRVIEKTEKLVDAKIKFKKGLMQQLLTHKKKLGKNKSDWSKVKIEDIFDRITTKNSVNNQNILTVSAQQGFIKQNLFFNKRIASELLHDYFLVEKGDFVYNKSYSNGYPLGAIKRLNDSDSGVVTTLYICFRKNESDLISPEFYEHYFEAGLINESLTRVAHEGGRAHGLLNITPNDFFNIEIDFPPIGEQKQIATILSTADREINLLNKKLKALKLQKKGLMQKLLTGEVRVKV